MLGEEIVNSDALDARFCEKVDLKRQDRVLAASRWTNVMLQPPSQALGMLIGAMGGNQALADEFTENFNYPDQQWDRVASAERIHAGHTDIPLDQIEIHVVGWLESCAPESCSERQLEELDRLIGPWLDDYERTSRAAKK